MSDKKKRELPESFEEFKKQMEDAQEDPNKEMLAIPGAVIEHMLAMGARFGVYCHYQALSQGRMKAKFKKILEAEGITFDENGIPEIEAEDIPDSVADRIRDLTKEDMEKFLLSDVTQGIIGSIHGQQGEGELFQAVMGFNTLCARLVKKLRKEGLIMENEDGDGDEEEEVELSEAEPESGLLN